MPKITPLSQFLAEQKIEPDLILDRLDSVYFPLAKWIADGCQKLQQQHADSPLVIGISGAQGTGKSTVAQILKILLHSEFDLETLVLSLDDFYLSKTHRKKLAEEIHHLLETRGVPGTHHVDSAMDLLDQLKNADHQKTIQLPQFCKRQDDCLPVLEWQIPENGIDVVLFEGWCVGVTPQDKNSLETPLNELEAQHDSSGIWRNFVNRSLEEYQPLFDRFHKLVMLKAPAMESVFAWRELQEQKLRERSGDGLSPEAVRQFVSHFERLTCHLLETLPERADVRLDLGEDHQISHIHFAD